MKQENKNFLYNVVYQIFIYIFPLITIPYISRVLGVDNIGIYSYTYSIVNCLMLFSMLGISNYGNREIAKRRDDINDLSRKFFSIYALQFICSLIMLIGYVLFLVLFCDRYQLIFLFQIINFVSVFFDINWFYFGLEKFKLTIKRNVLVKLLSTIFVFVFVKDVNDLVVYTIIMGAANLISQMYLFTQLKKYVVKVHITRKDIMSNVKSCLVLFIPVLAYSIYRIMDKTMIGFFSSVSELGYYENAEKIINIPISVITALGTVMLPRMSYLIKKDKTKVEETIFQSLRLAILLACNMVCGVILISNEGSTIIFGDEFIKSGLIMRLLSVTILVSTWANVFRTQYLIPSSKDKIYVYSTIGGAIINLVLNLIFIPRFGAIGACIGTICAESFLCFSQSFCLKNEFPMKKYLWLLVVELFKSIIIFVIAYTTCLNIENIYLKFIVEVLIYVILFVIINYKYIFQEFLGVGVKK